VGVNIALDKIVAFVYRQKMSEKNPDVLSTLRNTPEVLIYTPEKQRLEERLQIASQLWAQNIRV
jgi:hypothetical protein